MLEFFIFLCLGLVTAFLWRRYRLMNLRSKLGIPGPKANYIFGNVLDMKNGFQKYNETTPVFQKWLKEYGNVYGIYFGPSLLLVVNDLDIASEILVKQSANFMDRPIIPFMGQKPMCYILPRLRGELWKHVRNALTPTFTMAKLKQMSEAMAIKIDTFLNIIEQNSKDDKTVDVHKLLQGLTLDVIGKCALALDVKCQTDPNDLFLKHANTFFEQLSMQNSLGFLLCFLFPEFDWLISFFRPMSKTGIAERWIFQNLRKIIETRKLIMDKFKSVDVLQILLEQNEIVNEHVEKENSEKNEVHKITDDVLESSMFTYLVGGFETTSNTLGFMIWLLGKHKNVQQYLQQEIDKKLAAKEPINYETVHHMPYLDAVFKETLRCYPAASGFVSRECANDCEINGVTFLKGMKVLFLPRIIHNDPNNWDDPEEFHPDRFLNSKDYNPMSWLPFGIGPRYCIGMRFAEMEVKLTIFKLLSKFNIELGPGSKVAVTIFPINLRAVICVNKYCL